MRTAADSDTAAASAAPMARGLAPLDGARDAGAGAAPSRGTDDGADAAAAPVTAPCSTEGAGGAGLGAAGSTGWLAAAGLAAMVALWGAASGLA